MFHGFMVLRVEKHKASGQRWGGNRVTRYGGDGCVHDMRNMQVYFLI